MENKPSCKEFRLMADEYTDGSLGGAELEYFEAHLKECCECRAYLQELRALKKAVSESQKDIPDGLHSRIMDALQAEIRQARPNRKQRILKRTAIGAACAAICFSILLLVAMLPLWREVHNSGKPGDLYEGVPLDSAAEALPNDNAGNGDNENSTQDQAEGTATEPELEENTECVLDDETHTQDDAATNLVSAPDRVPECAVTGDVLQGAASEAEKNDVHPTDTQDSSNKPLNDSTQHSSEITAAGSSAPGGNEITMALLIVSGLLAVASFIAFLISLSSIRRAPHTTTDQSKEKKK